MDKDVSYQHLYDSLTEDEIRGYLELANSARLRVAEILKNILAKPSISEIVSEITIQVDPCVSELFWIIAANDTFWYSFNPWTALRHKICWLACSIGGFETMLSEGVWFIDNPDGTMGFWKLTPEQIELKIRNSLTRRIASLEKLEIQGRK